MTKKKKANVLIFNKKRGLRRHTMMPVVLTTATGDDVSGNDAAGILGAIAVTVTGNLDTGSAYVYTDTAGTGTLCTT